MAATPKFKVFDQDGNYLASARDATIAAGVISAVGTDGWLVKHTGRIIWREGGEVVYASDSIDYAAEIMNERVGSWTR